MLVIEVSRFGGPEVLTAREAPDAAAGPGQVVVQTAAADVLLVDTMIRSGRGVDFFPVRPPYVAGNGVAGQVIAVGDGVDPAWTSRSVVARTDGEDGAGGYAEHALVAVGDLIAVPAGLGQFEAAALLHDGATAFGLLETTAVKPGEWVLVTAAAGGMGLLLVQLARKAGAQVIGAARGPAKLALVGQAGADAAVDYSEPGWAGQVRELTGGHGADVVLDGAGGQLGRAAFEVTAPGGRFSAHGMSDGGFAAVGPGEAASRGITVYPIARYEPAELRRLAAAALAEAAAGQLEPVVGQTFPLRHAADAHRALEARTALAKTLLLP